MSVLSRLRIILFGLSISLLGITTSYAADLIEATRAGDADAVASLIAEGADLDLATGDGMTAVHWAAQLGQADILKALLDAGAEADPTTRIGSYTPLHIASGQGSSEIVETLLAAGADVNAKTTNSLVTALHLAAQTVGGADSVKALLEHGADPNAREGSAEQTPLMFAAAENRVASINLLLEAGADPSLSTTVVEVLKEVFADRQASQFLRDQLSDYVGNDTAMDASGVDAVQAAIQAQREFLQSGEAYQNFNTDDLINLRPDYPGGPDLPRPPYRETLVGATGGMTALLHAAREGHTESAQALLEGGADVNQVSGGDKTSPLLIATLNGQFDVAMLLIENGADPNLVATTDGAGPLFATLQTQWAPKSNYPQPRAQDLQQTEYMEVVNALLEAGADPNARLNTHLWYFEYGLTKIGTDLKGATPFWRAAYAQDIEVMKLLTEYGADPNIPTSWPAPEMRERRQQDGRQQEDSGLPYIPTDAFNAYPIHAAAGGGFTGLGSFSIRNVPGNFIPAVKYLVEEHGIDVNTLDSWGFTPMHYAAARGDNDLIRYLVSQGGDVTVITRLGQSTADMARGGRSGFFTRVAYPETEKLLLELGSSLECLHTHFLDTGDFCELAGVGDPWNPNAN
ncbi:MAG: ankyrin repeat domain-containing protein [Pseudomonadales bacterium]|nr:ankyrin repeat domain-containing protein [Pseudomonadales bacterium]